MIIKQGLLYAGKTKKVYRTSASTIYWIYYQDHGSNCRTYEQDDFRQQGILNNQFCQHFLKLLRDNGVENYLIEGLSPREMLVRRLDAIPLTVVIYNMVTARLTERLGIAAGTKVTEPIVEFYYQNEALGAPLLNDYHICTLHLASASEIDFLADQALRINAIIRSHLAEHSIELMELKLEFGRSQGEIMLGGEITPNTFSLRDMKTKQNLNSHAYRELYRNLTGSELTIN